MKTRINNKNGDDHSILGFGCMRFPTKGGSIDEPRSTAMIRDAIAKGINYFDTAYIYHGGKSESFLGSALAGGYREKVKIATKLPPFMVNKLDNAKKIFATQLSRLKTDYIDYYLLHMLTDKPMFDRLASLGVMEWMENLKAEGKIKNIGFSFHGSKADFEMIVKAYPWDFCQIQYNYMDENNQATKSGLQLAASIPNFLDQEQVTLGEGYLKNPFKLQADGTVMIPEGPGLGIELDEALIKDKIGHDWRNPESYNFLDGSVTDW